MNVKEWLASYRKLVLLRNELKAERQAIWEKLTSTTSSLSSDVVSSTKNPHKFDIYAELEGSIVELDEKIALRQLDITMAINRLDDELQQAVLISRFINLKTLQQTAEDMNYSVRQIQRLQAQAISAIKDVLVCPTHK